MSRLFFFQAELANYLKLVLMLQIVEASSRGNSSHRVSSTCRGAAQSIPAADE
jgi:hypothetical protein